MPFLNGWWKFQATLRVIFLQSDYNETECDRTFTCAQWKRNVMLFILELQKGEVFLPGPPVPPGRPPGPGNPVAPASPGPPGRPEGPPGPAGPKV